MVLGDAAGPVSQLTRDHRYRPGTSHGVSLRPRRTRVKRYLGRDREPSYASTRYRSPAIPAIYSGYYVGQNLLIEWRFAKGRNDRLPSFAAELVGPPFR